MRRAAKIDGTQAAIVDALRAAGCKVLSLAGVANGCPDLLVYYGAELTLLEVKNPKGKGVKLTADQIKFHADWPVWVVTSPEEALRAVGL